MTAVAGGAPLVAIGGADLVLGLSLLGIEAVRADTEAEARRALEHAMRAPGTSLILIDEARAAELRDVLEASMQASGRPLVVEVPGASGARLAESLNERLQRALGFTLRE